MNKIEPNRIMSNMVWDNIHIDNFNKAIITVGIRAKEEYVANLEQAVIDLVKDLELAKDTLETCSAHDPDMLDATILTVEQTIKRYS